MEYLGNVENKYMILSIEKDLYTYDLFEVIEEETKIKYIIKCLKKENEDIPANEIEILNKIKNINNPYISKFIGHGKGNVTLNNEEPKIKSYLIFEYMTKFPLYYYVSGEAHGFGEKQAKLIFRKILNGIQAIHETNICHLDIKAQNILLDDNYNPKIFGFEHSCLNADDLKNFVGTQNYASPEIFNSKPFNGIKADIFSLGTLLFILVNGILPFHSSQKFDVYYSRIIVKKYQEYWNSETIRNLNLSDSFKNLFVKMVAYNPNERPSIDDILNDEWMQEINNLNAEQLNNLEDEVREEFQARRQN